MKIFVDADGCPVTKLCVEVSKKYNIECKIICDTSHYFCIEGAETITVSKGADSVDFKLVNLLSEGDVAVTQDYGLAAMCLAKKALVLNQNGIVYNDMNIMSLLNNRHISKIIRKNNGRIKGPKKRDKNLDEMFRNKLEEIILKNLEL